MEKVHFMSSIGERPVRLSDETRWFAYESLNHKYGLDTGWNARFVTLNKEWQDMIISQTEDVVL